MHLIYFYFIVLYLVEFYGHFMMLSSRGVFCYECVQFGGKGC